MKEEGVSTYAFLDCLQSLFLCPPHLFPFAPKTSRQMLLVLWIEHRALSGPSQIFSDLRGRNYEHYIFRRFWQQNACASVIYRQTYNMQFKKKAPYIKITIEILCYNNICVAFFYLRCPISGLRGAPLKSFFACSSNC